MKENEKRMGYGLTGAVIEGDLLKTSCFDQTPSGELVVCASDGFKYRRSVCVFIMNEHGCFLGCQRCDDRRVVQCVQGGVLAHETPQQTAEREVLEEIGLPATRLRFVSEVVPLETGGDVRAAFRYNSKSWRKLGIKGQELYPLLYLADVNIVSLLNFKAVPGIRQEFRGASWVTLDDLMNHSSPSKAVVMANICVAVASLVHRLLGVEKALSVKNGINAQSTGKTDKLNVESEAILGHGSSTDARDGVGDARGHHHRKRRKNKRKEKEVKE